MSAMAGIQLLLLMSPCQRVFCLSSKLRVQMMA